jgi:hypothetical protein
MALLCLTRDVVALVSLFFKLVFVSAFVAQYMTLSLTMTQRLKAFFLHFTFWVTATHLLNCLAVFSFVIVSQHCVLSQVFTLAVRTTLVFAVP